jgi:hypothetical protein
MKLHVLEVIFVDFRLMKSIIFNKTESFVGRNTSDHACQIFLEVYLKQQTPQLLLNTTNLPTSMAVSETDKAYHRNFRLYFLVISYVKYIFYFRLFECNKYFWTELIIRSLRVLCY